MYLRPDGILDPFGKYPNPFNGRPYSDYYKKQAFNIKTDSITGEQTAEGWSMYKTYQDRMDILKKIHMYQIILVIAGTGVGKTVIVPKLLAHYFNYKKPIIITTPRQAMTSSNAEYASLLLDVPLYYYRIDDGKPVFIKDKDGKNMRTGMTHVGYKHGDEKTLASEDTKLLYATDGLIKTMIVTGDPELSQYGGIIIDEAHERKVSIDILISLITEIAKKRPDFKIIIMSATVNEQIFIDYFKNSGLGDYFTTYNVSGVAGQFKVLPEFATNSVTQSSSINETFKIVNNLLMNPKPRMIKGKEYQGDILVFISIIPDGTKLKEMIDKKMNIYPENSKPYSFVLTAKSPKIQHEIAQSSNGLSKIHEREGVFHRKVIISTNFAEAGMTFSDPIFYVVDGGLSFSSVYDADKYCTILGKMFIAQANIKQRCGRTGRINEGICYHVYGKNQYDNEFDKYPKPEILTTDLTKELLNLICLKKIGSVSKLHLFLRAMIEPFDNYKKQVERGLENLTEGNMINKYGELTILGNICSKFHILDIKLAKMIIGGYYLGVMPECIALASILSAKGLNSISNLINKFNIVKTMNKFKHESGDHLTLLTIFMKWFHHDNKPSFVAEYGLDSKMLNSINTNYKEIQASVLKIRDDITELELFTVVGDNTLIFGGGSKTKKKYDSYKKTAYHANNTYGLVGGFNQPSTTHFSKSNSNFNKVERKYTKKREGYTTHGGGGETLNQYNTLGHSYNLNHLNQLQDGGKQKKKKKKPYEAKPESKKEDDAKPESKKEDNAKPESKKEDNAKPESKKEDNAKPESKKKNKPDETKPEVIKKDTKPESKKKGAKPEVIKKDAMKFRDITPEEKEKERKEAFFSDPGVKRRQTLINEYTLRNIPRYRKIKPFDRGDLNVLACMLYGFSTQLGIYSGKQDKYIIKYSPLTPIIDKDSILSTETPPKIILYHTCLVQTHTPNIATLSFVSTIPNKVLGYFIERTKS